MHPIQLLLVCFALFGVVRGLMRFRRGQMQFANLAAWLLFWCAVTVVALLPETTSVVAGWLGVGRGADFAMYLAMLAMFSLLFRMFGKVEDLERQITRVVRAAALRELEDEMRADQPDSAKHEPEAQRECKIP
jgi:hypothetical protein